ncbi:MAG: hypothetical protein JJU13_18920 [Balneolaceae bacterium]|nr:hypothetical protein [Balneolaceae bacterium]
MKINHDINQLKNKACIRITLIIDPGLIVIKNTGQSDAKNVRIILDGIPANKYPGMLIKKNCHTIPPKSTLAIQACVNTELFPSDYIEILWDDEESDNKTYQIPLYF